MVLTLIQQVAVIFVLMGVGVFLKRRKIVSYEAAAMFSNMVLMLILPALIVRNFQREFAPELLGAMGLSLLFAVGFHLLAILLTRFLLPDRGEDQRIVARLLAICSNCGFMGIPLIQAVLGEKATLYAIIYIAVFNVYVWTHGAMLARKAPKIYLKEIIKAPGVIAALLGMGLFLLQIRLPGLILETLDYLAAMNTPLPTILTGIFIADISPRELLRDLRLYYAGALRLLVLPLVFLGLIWVSRSAHWFDGAQTVAMAAMLSCACPGAVTTIMIPAKFGGDVRYGAKLIAVSNLLSIVTIPLIAFLSQLVLPL